LSTTVDLLLIRTSRQLIRPFLHLAVFANFQEDTKVLQWVDHFALIDTMVEKWDQDLQEVFLISMIRKQIRKLLKMSYPISTFHKVMEVSCLVISTLPH